MYFKKHLSGGCDRGYVDELYLWHLWQRSNPRMQRGLATDKWKFNLEDYVTAAKSLAISMQEHGFLSEHAIPLDIDGELLNGSHRLACAVALGIKQIPVSYEPRRAWAPAWDYMWFESNGISDSRLEDILSHRQKMLDSLR